MSSWTHITACLSVDTNFELTKPKLKTYVQEILKHAPIIKGSEANADVYVNIPSGYNFYKSIDCNTCKYKDDLIQVRDSKTNELAKICFHKSNSNCSRKYQTMVIISIQGDLRDTYFKDTQACFDKFKNYVEKNVGYIRDYAVNIEEG